MNTCNMNYRFLLSPICLLSFSYNYGRLAASYICARSNNRTFRSTHFFISALVFYSNYAVSFCCSLCLQRNIGEVLARPALEIPTHLTNNNTFHCISALSAEQYLNNLSLRIDLSISSISKSIR